MYIKGVNIQGFKSYREQLNLDNFSPRHNVIVGRNGSGKSNFFFAIQFVLSDEFTHLRQEQRQALLHEGTGPRVQTAKVEIIFDNKDGRIPIEKEEVRLVRQVGAKKDQYFLDNKVVTRAEVQNLMESAGFSRSNPYYIVKQGKINELATAPDAARLKLLKEVAGTRVYDERKEESISTMRDTESKRDKIESLLAYIEERLTTLEAEKEELKEYQKWDKMKRALEYTLYEQEQKENRIKEMRLQQQRDEINEKKDELVNKQQDITSELQRIKRARRDLENRFSGLKSERDQLNSDHSQYFQQKTQIELKLKDLKNELEQAMSSRHNAENELTELRRKIADRMARVNEIAPVLKKALESEKEVDTRIKIMEARKHELFIKQGYKDRYHSREERDKAIEAEIRDIERKIQQERGRLERLEREIEQEQRERDELREMIAKHTQETDARRDEMENKMVEQANRRKEYEELQDRRRNLWREEHTLDNMGVILEDELQQAQAALSQSSGKAIQQGCAAVRKVLETLREKGNAQQVLDGYHGMLIENFETDAEYYRAVDTVAGQRLFYHIVDNDRISIKILEEINKLKLPGDVSFFPLNRLTAPNNVHYPETPNALPMLRVLRFDQRFDIVMRSVFAKSMVTRNIQTSTEIAKEHRLDCVTLEGDTVQSRGVMSGGYVDPTRRRSRLELQANVVSVRRRLHDLEEEKARLKRDCDVVDADIMRAQQNITNIDNEVRYAKDAFEKLSIERRAATDRLTAIESNRRTKEQAVAECQSFVRQLEAQKEGKRKALAQDMSSQLSATEQRELDAINRDLHKCREELEAKRAERQRLDEEKSALDNELEANLLRRREALQAEISNVSVEERRHDQDRLRAEQERLQAKIIECSTKLAAIEEDMSEYTAEKDKLSKENETASEQEKEILAGLQECSKQQELIATKNTAIQKKKDELKKRFAEIGALPADAFDKYQNLSHKQLEKKLLQCNHELKKYENVNKKALDQFVSFSEQREKLAKRKEELDRAYQAINNLMTTLDHRKYEAIQLTFKQVSRNFAEVFQQLVPGGKAELIMKMSETPGGNTDVETTMEEVEDDVASSSSGEEESAGEGPSSKKSASPRKRKKKGKKKEHKTPSHPVENFTGVGIKVSFTGTGETREMNQLSGGQKSLVALTLIFAIQKCDPAPFYLFDEIDAALDAQHRKAVADMIHSLVSEAQFITTTFRPELLEHADKFFGVLYRAKVSHVTCVPREQAYDFVENEQVHQ